MWYGKMAAEESANILAKFESGILKEDEAFEQIKDWKSRMTAAIRYRDHKGRIGSIVHHWLYEKALGISIRDLNPWIFATIESLQLVKREESGDDYTTTLGIAAADYIRRASAWYDKFAPEWEAIGQEAVVVNKTIGYAGTCDGIGIFHRSKWPKEYKWVWADKDSVRLLVDFKTSKSVKDTYWWQVEAYRHAEFIGLMEDGSEHETPLTEGSVIIHIKPDSPVAMLTSEPNESIWEAFCSLVHVYNVREEKISTAKVKKMAQSRASTPKAGGPRKCPF